MDFHVCEERELPDELRKLIEEKKKKEFCLIYETDSYCYVIAGYGNQEKDCYVAAVKEFYETEQEIFLDTILLSTRYVNEMPSGKPDFCPYVVLRCEKTEKPILFL